MENAALLSVGGPAKANHLDVCHRVAHTRDPHADRVIELPPQNKTSLTPVRVMGRLAEQPSPRTAHKQSTTGGERGEWHARASGQHQRGRKFLAWGRDAGHEGRSIPCGVRKKAEIKRSNGHKGDCTAVHQNGLRARRRTKRVRYYKSLCSIQGRHARFALQNRRVGRLFGRNVNRTSRAFRE